MDCYPPGHTQYLGSRRGRCGGRHYTQGGRGPVLRDDFQNVKDQLHDDGALAQLTRAAVDDGDESAVQVAQVLGQERLTVTASEVSHL